MADAGLTEIAGTEFLVARDDLGDLQETLVWARGIRTNPNHTTTALLLADVVIEQTQQLTAKATAWMRDPEKWAAAVKKRTENLRWRANQILIHHKRLENPSYRKNVAIAQRARRAREKEEERLRLQDHHLMCISAFCALASTCEESS